MLRTKIRVANLRQTHQGIKVDRSSVLGNPFQLCQEGERDLVCDAYEQYFQQVVAGGHPVQVSHRIAKANDLLVTSAWKRPTQKAFMAELQRVGQALQQDSKQPLLCWCADKRCHAETIANHWDRSLSHAIAAESAQVQLSPASPERSTELLPHQVFVFGSNSQGRHGKGAALQARQWGAQYGNPKGRQGSTYAIVTKDLKRGERSISLQHIKKQIIEFLDHAGKHPQNEFLVTKIGCSLAGYSEQEIGELWQGKAIPSNVRLPKVFVAIILAQG